MVEGSGEQSAFGVRVPWTQMRKERRSWTQSQRCSHVHTGCVYRLSGGVGAGVPAPAGGPRSEGTAHLSFLSTDALGENSWEEEPAGDS